MISKVIPSYAKDFKKEYLFIFDIIKRCEKFIDNLGQENVFNSSEAKNLILCFNKFIVFQSLNYFKDISDFYLKKDDVNFIEYLDKREIYLIWRRI